MRLPTWFCLRLPVAFLSFSISILSSSPTLRAADLVAAVAQIKQVAAEGKGNQEAKRAWDDLVKLEVEKIPELIGAMDDANDLASNWLRSAVEALAERSRAEKKQLPIAALGTFLLDTRHDPQSRQLAYDLLLQTDAPAVRSLLPGMLNDPNMNLRREAIQGVIEQASAAKASNQTTAATLLYQQALSFSRDPDQIELVAGRLKELGQTVDIAALFGWVRNWKVIGPFDNSKREGFAREYSPEQKVKLDEAHQGKSGKVSWKDYTSKDEYGKIDFNQPFGKLKEAIAYGYTELRVDRARSVELRLGCKNAWKIWLNGQLLFARDEYHRGAEIDQYRLKAELKPGKNTLLVKLGQNEQTEDWTVEWEFQLRVTDHLGTPITPLRVGVEPPTTASR